MFCRNCEKSLPEGSKFCDGCGAQLNSAPQPQESSALPANNQKPKSKKTGGIIMAVLGALSVLGSLANGFIRTLQKTALI